MSKRFVADVAGRDRTQVKVDCPRCGWKGTASECFIVEAAHGHFPYCPKCDYPLSETPAEGVPQPPVVRGPHAG
jgi:hypothetical protein